MAANPEALEDISLPDALEWDADLPARAADKVRATLLAAHRACYACCEAPCGLAPAKDPNGNPTFVCSLSANGRRSGCEDRIGVATAAVTGRGEYESHITIEEPKPANPVGQLATAVSTVIARANL